MGYYSQSVLAGKRPLSMAFGDVPDDLADVLGLPDEDGPESEAEVVEEWGRERSAGDGHRRERGEHDGHRGFSGAGAAPADREEQPSAEVLNTVFSDLDRQRLVMEERRTQQRAANNPRTSNIPNIGDRFDSPDADLDSPVLPHPIAEKSELNEREPFESADGPARAESRLPLFAGLAPRLGGNQNTPAFGSGTLRVPENLRAAGSADLARRLDHAAEDPLVRQNSDHLSGSHIEDEFDPDLDSPQNIDQGSFPPPGFAPFGLSIPPDPRHHVTAPPTVEKYEMPTPGPRPGVEDHGPVDDTHCSFRQDESSLCQAFGAGARLGLEQSASCAAEDGSALEQEEPSLSLAAVPGTTKSPAPLSSPVRENQIPGTGDKRMEMLESHPVMSSTIVADLPDAAAELGRDLGGESTMRERRMREERMREERHEEMNGVVPPAPGGAVVQHRENGENRLPGVFKNEAASPQDLMQTAVEMSGSKFEQLADGHQELEPSFPRSHEPSPSMRPQALGTPVLGAERGTFSEVWASRLEKKAEAGGGPKVKIFNHTFRRHLSDNKNGKNKITSSTPFSSLSDVRPPPHT